MSIIWSLKKLIDPITHRQEEAARRRDREQPKYSLAGDPPAGGDEQDEGGMFSCAACGRRSAEGGFCPTCLADTMRPCAEEEEEEP